METSNQEFKITPKLKKAIIEIVEERLRETQIIRKDISELRGVVKELAEAQKRTEQRVEQLAEAQKKTEQRIEELVGAQKRTEQRVKELAEAQKRTEQRVEELAEAQKKTEERLTRVEGAIEELAEAQKRTEQRVEELAEAQKRTEQRVEQLAEAQKKTEERLTRVEGVIEELAKAQKRTEEELRELIKEHKETRAQLGGLSITIGYRLEDESYKALPELLKRDYGIIIQERLKRQFIQDKSGVPLEVNIFGSALRDGKKITIIGEAKSQLSKNGIDEFIKKKLNKIQGLFEELFPVLVTYMISEPDAEEYAKQKGIAIYYSYDF
jgi:chromosome segregation ATPase